jgi:diguanylate cyclase (GGDEF)-like protein/PAS domain S-box-containing protein
MEARSDHDGAVQGALDQMAERFAEGGTWLSHIDEVLACLGPALGADRAYVFQNVRDPNGRLWMDLRAEWDAPGVRTIFDRPTNHLHPYAPDFTRWIDVLGEGGTIDAIVADLPRSEQRVLEGEDVVGVIAVPVFAAGDWWGFVAYDNTHDTTPWDQDHLHSLAILAGLLGGAAAVQQESEFADAVPDRYRAIIEHIPAITYMDALNDQASSLFVSPQIEQMLGYTVEEWMTDPDLWPTIIHPDDRPRALAENARHNETGAPFDLEYRVFTKDGRLVWLQDQALIVRDQHGTPLSSNGVIMDITDRKRGEEHVAFNAYHDELTGLPNRAMFDELLELSITRASHHAGSVAVVVVDLDDFRLVNDSLGHQQGDTILKLVADRLRGATRETDLVARRGGDQFLLLLADLERDGGGDMDAALIRAESVVQRIHAALRAPLEALGTELFLSASMGISLYPQDAADGSALMRNAEAAMYESKKTGPSGHVVSSGGDVDSAGKLRFVTQLRKAVEANQWTLFYQPVVELATGKMTGVEALIRWIEPGGNIIGPNDFIPLAEELGLIEAIGDWVVGEIVYQGTAWLELGIDLEIGFNLSPRQFWQPDLSARIIEQIVGGGLDPTRVMVEITETSAMMDPDRAQEILWALKGGGLRLAIDDFGTGYSSLSRLREMPVDVLKIDRSFVDKVDLDKQAASIVTAFVELARGLEMTTLAEGIETAGEHAFLVDRRCPLGQGFLFSQPVPPEEIIAMAFSGIPSLTPVRTA